MYDHIVTHTIGLNQFGFLKNSSTVQQLLAHLYGIVNSLTNHVQSDVVYLDIRKAFDSVSHNGLLLKLWSAGVCGLPWQLIRSYLYGRKQCVRVGSSFSSLLDVTSGVPQGSILGPLLFLLSINDLSCIPIYSSVLLFADDSKCRRAIRSIEDCQLLQADLDSFCEWSLSSSLRFNNSKSFVVRFHPPRTNPYVFHYSLDGGSIMNRAVCKDLGVLFSSSLSWSPQVKAVLKKAYGVLWMLKHVFPCTTTTTAVKRKLYLTLVIPILTYCCQVWRPSLIKDIVALELLQRRATKYILNDFVSDYKTRLLHLKLLPLSYQLELVEITFFISQLRSRTSHFDILDYFSFSSASTRFGTSSRLVHSSYIPLSARHTFFHRFPRLWNSLPPIDLSLSLSSIKVKIKNFFSL
uniref:Reverse transcriptase domain-containing protein n=1 Tax=Amphimedon queenslandica TaxID=400682 RepID=A0A1X7TJ20_AMPQE